MFSVAPKTTIRKAAGLLFSALVVARGVTREAEVDRTRVHEAEVVADLVLQVTAFLSVPTAKACPSQIAPQATTAQENEEVKESGDVEVPKDVGPTIVITIRSISHQRMTSIENLTNTDRQVLVKRVRRNQEREHGTGAGRLCLAVVVGVERDRKIDRLVNMIVI